MVMLQHPLPDPFCSHCSAEEDSEVFALEAPDGSDGGAGDVGYGGALLSDGSDDLYEVAAAFDSHGRCCCAGWKQSQGADNNAQPGWLAGARQLLLHHQPWRGLLSVRSLHSHAHAASCHVLCCVHIVADGAALDDDDGLGAQYSGVSVSGLSDDLAQYQVSPARRSSTSVCVCVGGGAPFTGVQ